MPRMLLPLLLALGTPAHAIPARPTEPPTAPPSTVYSGRQRELDVRLPRLEAGVEIDGRLDEPVWAQAALLTEFSQYAPMDGVPAQDSTEVLVWYSPTAIHFGIRAHEAHGAVHATLADRDRIGGDDYVQIFLGTFDDGRQATLFGVNPLGVQEDGSLVETGRVQSNGFNAATVTREAPDLSPDFIFQSKGRVTASGYEVEVRIPFKSLRYQGRAEQRWGINVLRRVQHSGYEDSWAPARRAAASFLGQSGRLVGLTDLRRGLVLDLNPVVTQRANGGPDSLGQWDYHRDHADVGGNVRWGVTNNLTLNGTVNPDFSQVEADVGQVAFDPRSALFFPERRPFFLEGIEQFAVPSQLIYTRRIVQPVAATKLTGKVSGTDIAFLSAVDDTLSSFTRQYHPMFNIVRVQRDVGAQSRLGLAYTDKLDGADFNRVASVDGRIVFRSLYTAQFQVAGSRTRLGPRTDDGPLWNAAVARNGRAFGFRYALSGIDPDFRALSGFISRPGIVNSTVTHRYTLFGAQSSPVQSLTTDLTLYGTWNYRRFTRRQDAMEKKAHVNLNAALRGGWQAGGSVLVETFGYDDALYADYAVALPTAGGGVDTVPFTGTARLPNLDYVLSLNTPQFKRFAGSAFVLWGRDENFYEWASANIVYAELHADWRPTEKVRVSGQYLHQQFDRRTDGSTVGLRRIPRLKLEYQIARPLFVRVVGQYDAYREDDRRDDSRTGAPLLIYDPEVGDYVRALGFATNDFRADWLVSYQPSPGTVIFAGYGSSMEERQALRFGRSLRRTADGFFVKVSYLFRV
jgi:hypothetical protein